MKNNQEEIIWSYLDGQASSEERRQLEQRLSADESLKQLFLECRLLRESLQAIETESPSMRFSQNVMDKLPAVRSLADGPLISSKWLKTFYWIVASSILFVVGSTWGLSPGLSVVQDQQVSSILNTLNSIFGYISGGTLFLAGIIMISLFLLRFLDRWLQSKFVKS